MFDPAKLPMTVSDLAIVCGVSRKTISAWIVNGHFKAKLGVPPTPQRGQSKITIVTAGYPPLSSREWRRIAAEEVAKVRPKGTFGFDADDQLHVLLPSTNTVVIKNPELYRLIPEVIARIRQLGAGDGAA